MRYEEYLEKLKNAVEKKLGCTNRGRIRKCYIVVG